jgi:hypothetical protein
MNDELHLLLASWDHRINDECPECFHRPHSGVCEHERGDAWVTGRDGTQGLMAMGPCPCTCKLDAYEQDREDNAVREGGMKWKAKEI